MSYWSYACHTIYVSTAKSGLEDRICIAVLGTKRAYTNTNSTRVCVVSVNLLPTLYKFMYIALFTAMHMRSSNPDFPVPILILRN